MQAGAAVALRSLLGRDVLVLELDPKAIREPFDRAGEVEPLRVPDELDHVAALVAAEAVVEAEARVDREAWRALLVERAAADEAGALLAQRRALLDDRDEVGRSLDRLDRVVLDPGHQSFAAYDSANRSVIPAMNSTDAPCSKILRIVARARSCSGRVSGPR